LTIFRQQADLIHTRGADIIDRFRMRSTGLAEIFVEVLTNVRDCAGFFRILSHEIGILAHKREQREGARLEEVLLIRELSYGGRVGIGCYGLFGMKLEAPNLVFQRPQILSLHNARLQNGRHCRVSPCSSGSSPLMKRPRSLNASQVA
jgi:hypothetical protein